MCILSRSPMMCGCVIASPRGLLFCPQSLWWFCILRNWQLHPSWTALLHLLLWNNVLLCFPLPWLSPLCLPFWLLFNHWDVQVSVLGIGPLMCICFSAMLMTFKYALKKFSPLLSGSLYIPSDILRRVSCCNCKLNMFKSEFTIFTLGLSIGSYPGLKISCLTHTFLWHM